VIGPLDKPGVAEINAAPNRLVPVLALNYLPPGVAANAGLSIFFYACGSVAFWALRRPPAVEC
jgi:outer membrane PBP1 activator LpoA protein